MDIEIKYRDLINNTFEGAVPKERAIAWIHDALEEQKAELQQKPFIVPDYVNKFLCQHRLISDMIEAFNVDNSSTTKSVIQWAKCKSPFPLDYLVTVMTTGWQVENTNRMVFRNEITDEYLRYNMFTHKYYHTSIREQATEFTDEAIGEIPFQLYNYNRIEVDSDADE